MKNKKHQDSKPPFGGLGGFYYYLKDNRLKETTAQEHIKNIERFTAWAKENDLSLPPSGEDGRGLGIEHIKYNELLNYVQHLKSKSLSTSTVNIRISSIRKYYEHLKEEGITEVNPAKRLFIKGTIKKIVKDVISYTELETLYQQYAEYLDKKPTREKKQEQTRLRSKVITGLMIWQGVHSGDLERMETKNVNLQSGTIYIPSSARGNSRELKLSTVQIIPLHSYLNTLPKEQEKLFDCYAHNQITRITSELKGISQIIRNAQHIRASVIFHWLKMYDKRQVQYMIGHKWISSTENYEVQELDGLTDLLAKHHPFS
jgi:site-specific recombinase XerD